MKKILVLLLAVVCTTEVYATDNVYVGGNVGFNTTWGTFAWNVDGGYMFNKNFGLEGGLTGSSTYYTDYWMLDGAVKGVLPITDLISIYGKAGLALNSFSYGSNLGILLGAGAQYSIDRYWTLHVEDYASTGYQNPNFLMFGGQYSF